MADRFDKFTERARRVFLLAQEEAQRLRHDHIGTEHLLLGLVREGDGVAANVLTNMGVDAKKVRVALEMNVGRGERHSPREIGLTPRGKRAVERAIDEARRLGHRYIGTEHLLLGLIGETSGVAVRVLESLGVNLEHVRAETTRILSADLPQGGPAPGVADDPDLRRLRVEAAKLRAELAKAISKQEHKRAGMLREQESGVRQRMSAIERERQAPGSGASTPPIELGASFRDAFALGLALSLQSRRVLQLASEEAKRLGHAQVGPEHLLVALLTPDGELSQELQRRGVALDTLRQAVEAALRGSTGDPEGAA